MSQAEGLTEQGNGAWTEELDAVIQVALHKHVPHWLYDDALQDARVALLEAEGGHEAGYYIARAVYAAKDCRRRERRRADSTQAGRAMPLGEPVGDDGDLLSDLLADERATPPDSILGAREDRATLRNVLKTALGALSARERQVIQLRFGLGNGNGRGHTLEEVGEKCGVTGEAVRLVQVAALKKLRTALRDGVDE